MSPYETRSIIDRMVWASAAWMAVEMLATLCITKLQGDARPSLYPRTACCRVAAGAMGRGRRRLASAEWRARCYNTII